MQLQDPSAAGGVDLRLAVNYVPACVCFFKSGMLLCVLCCIHTVQSVACYVPVALTLALDRLHSPLAIFDGNGVLLSLFFAHCVNHIREEAGLRSVVEAYYSFVVSPLWPLLAVLALFDFPIPFLRQRGLSGLFCETAFFISVMAFMPMESESYIVRIVRGLIFVMLSFAWAYIIGIHQRRMAQPVDSSVHFAVYFSPVLYVQGFLALAFSGVALLSLIVLMRRDAGVTVVVRGVECGPDVVISSSLSCPREHDEGLNEMEEAFRQAKALRASQTGPNVKGS